MLTPNSLPERSMPRTNFRMAAMLAARPGLAAAQAPEPGLGERGREEEERFVWKEVKIFHLRAAGWAQSMASGGVVRRLECVGGRSGRTAVGEDRSGDGRGG